MYGLLSTKGRPTSPTGTTPILCNEPFRGLPWPSAPDRRDFVPFSPDGVDSAGGAA